MGKGDVLIVRIQCAGDLIPSFLIWKNWHRMIGKELESSPKANLLIMKESKIAKENRIRGVAISFRHNNLGIKWVIVRGPKDGQS